MRLWKISAIRIRLFPISEFVDQFDRFSDGSFPIHWHPELEMQIILRAVRRIR